MTRKNRMLWSWCLLAAIVSLVCVVPGGAAGSDQDRGPNPGGCCDKTGTFAVQFSVKIDPANHHAVIQLRDGRLVIVRLSDGTFEVRGNRSAIIRATTDLSSSSCGFPLANGSGTVAGFPNVTGRYKEVEVTGHEIGGLLELGVNGELPTGQAICYEFTGTRDPNVPDSGAAQVDLAVQFTLLLARNAPVKPPPGFIFGLGPNVLGIGWGTFLYRGDGTGGLIPAGQLPLTDGLESVATSDLFRFELGTDAYDSVSSALRHPVTGELLLNVHTQTQDGTFERTHEVPLSPEYNVGNVFIVAGDLTGDGASEIVTASELGRVDVFSNNEGTLAILQTLDVGSTIVGLLPVLADFNGDGSLDAVLLSREPGEPTLYLNTFVGDGTGQMIPGPTTEFPLCVEDIVPPVVMDFGSLDGDGLLDLVVAMYGGACPEPGGEPFAVPLLNLSDQPGAFAPQTPFVIPGSDTIQATLFTPPCAGTPALVANGGLYVGTGDGGFVDSGVRFALDGVPPVDVLAADVDLNGVVDLTALYCNNDQLSIQTLSLDELAPRPVLTSVSVVGKNLVVQGSGFPAGSQILVDGVPYKTKADRASPDTKVTSKKALKKIRAGTPVTVQVRTPDGVVSEGRIFTR